jgi:hypothetical protein
MLEAYGRKCGMGELKLIDPNWFSWEPESEDRMRGCYWRYTTCEVLRHIYELMDAPDANKEEIKMNLRVAATMAKSMAKWITKYEGRGWGRRVYPLTPWWSPDKPGAVLPRRGRL